MANYDILRVLIDQGNSCDIIYINLLQVMRLTCETHISYKGSDLLGFNNKGRKVHRTHGILQKKSGEKDSQDPILG